MTACVRFAIVALTTMTVVVSFGASGRPLDKTAAQPPSAGSRKNEGPVGSEAPATYKALVVARYKSYLKDPYSVRSAEISDASPKFTGLLNGGNRPAVCVRYNAKNSFGAYIGIQTEIIFFQNGAASSPFVNVFGCNEKIAYSPFPELERIK